MNKRFPVREVVIPYGKFDGVNIMLELIYIKHFIIAFKQFLIGTGKLKCRKIKCLKFFFELCSLEGMGIRCIPYINSLFIVNAVEQPEDQEPFIRCQFHFTPFSKGYRCITPVF